MADKSYKLKFNLSDGTTQEVPFTAPQGPPGADGYTPVKGTDYWTEADKAEIVAAVLAEIPDGNEVEY